MKLSELLQCYLPPMTVDTKTSLDALEFRLSVSTLSWAIMRLIDVQQDENISYDEDALKLAIAFKSCDTYDKLLFAWVSLFRTRKRYPAIEYELIRGAVEFVGHIHTPQGFALMAGKFSAENVVFDTESPPHQRVAPPPLQQMAVQIYQ